ncbi:hypothetical protein [Hwanghaeella sp. 1Z406]|jgi:hypothetical protein|uniref:hypothetical protein n=1 Tax=Hwanghaeella sp. 1Z406 TaxID=3402811 RepID=UPI00267873A3|tara:strand:+ start:88938 stop:89966 length:1029 start_codon:yes stop_codon:yes gene_type:complete
MSKKPSTIAPIDASFDDVVNSIVSPATKKEKGNNGLKEQSDESPATPMQLSLDLGIEVEKVVGGIEMGVLQNGIPYLTQRGLAIMCGAARATLFEITQEWEGMQASGITPRGRMAFFKDYLLNNDYDEPRLFIEISKNGSPHYAYPDVVCMAFVEYFAFEAQKTNDTAVENYRRLARFGLQQFIYKALDYHPEDKWKYFRDRVSLLKESAPDGYFIIFNEVTGIAVDLINAGLSVNDKTIPDISVGQAWGAYWNAGGLDAEYGQRVKWDHYYPEYYPQSASNPQSPWAYPDTALPLFRRWLRHEYLPTKFPPYILKKAHVLAGGKQEAEKIAAIYDQKQIEG